MSHHVWDLVQYGAYRTSIPFTYLSLCHQGIPNLLSHVQAFELFSGSEPHFLFEQNCHICREATRLSLINPQKKAFCAQCALTKQIINHLKKSINLYMIFTLVYYDIVHMSSELFRSSLPLINFNNFEHFSFLNFFKKKACRILQNFIY